MKLISLIYDSQGYTYATDMGTVDFLRWTRAHLGSVAITWELEISKAEFQRWQAEGGQIVLANQFRA